ncbi:MAG: AAA family ATPase [Phycisphaerales bacterium]|nr:AAA family ATPase [Phycisphaerales bacterium]
MQDALRRLYSHDALTAEDEDDLLCLCVTKHGLSYTSGKTVEARPITAAHVPVEGHTGPAVTLADMLDLQNVNALAPDQKLHFAQRGLTIVYGANGSGKSGYVRVLERACRARHREERLLPNVYAGDPNTPAKATFKFREGDQDHSVSWEDKPNTSPPAMSRISVFDARCADVHVEASNELAYRPRALSILSALAKTAKRLKEKLQAAERKLEAEGPPWLQASPRPYHDYSRVGELLARLAPTTDWNTVEALAVVSEEEKHRTEQLRRDLGEPPEKAIQRHRGVLARLKAVIDLVADVDEKLSDDRLAVFRRLCVDAETNAEASRLAASRAFRDDPLRGVGSETWRALWEAARQFSQIEAFPSQPYPVTEPGKACVLCQQPLSNDGAERLARFERFVQDTTQREADRAASARETARRAFAAVGLGANARSAAVDHIQSEHNDAELARSLRLFLVTARLRQRTLRRLGHPNELQNVRALQASPSSSLATISQRITERMRQLADPAASSARKKLERELHELEDRVWLGSVLDVVRSEIARLGKLEKVRAAIRDTNTDPITRRATLLAKVLVTDRLRDAFADEANKLGLGYLRAEMKQLGGDIGDPKFGIRLIRSPNAKIGQVFSEGEHRCIALAAFLAELATADEPSGLVFDDPISSLDHNHREDVAKRLVALSQVRQVILFSHDLPFVFMLDHYAGECNAPRSFQYIARTNDRVGIASANPPFKAIPPRRALEGISTHLRNKSHAYEAGQHDDWTIAAKGIAGHLRDCWELAVEQALRPVVSRFAHKVKPGELKIVCVLTRTDADEAADGYGQCSRWAHSDSPELGMSSPTPQQLTEEIQKLTTWLARVESAQRSAGRS